MDRWRRRLVASLVVWAIVTLAYVALLAAERSSGDLGCEDPDGSSNYGHAMWQWWPPGTACRYRATRVPSYGRLAAHVDRPSALAGVAVVVLVLWPIATLLFARALLRRERVAPST